MNQNGLKGFLMCGVISVVKEAYANGHLEHQAVNIETLLGTLDKIKTSEKRMVYLEERYPCFYILLL